MLDWSPLDTQSLSSLIHHINDLSGEWNASLYLCTVHYDNKLLCLIETEKMKFLRNRMEEIVFELTYRNFDFL